MEETKDLVKQFLSKEGLQYYDGKIKDYVAEQIADAKDYADSLAVNYDAAGDADKALAAAKAYADSLVSDEDGSRFDLAGSAAQALADAKTEMGTRGLKEGKVLGTAAYANTTDFDAAGSAAKALADAKADAASLYQVKGDYEAAGAAEQALADAKTYVDGKVDGKFDAAGSAAQALADAKADAASLYQVKGDYEAAGAAADALDAAKAYVDGKVDGKFDAAGSAAQALVDAKAYADGLATKYDAAGAAAKALADAKAEMVTRGLKEGEVLGTAAYAKTTDFDAAGTAEGFNTAMNTRVEALEAIDHAKLAADASAAAVAAIVDGASDSFDTLREVAEWIANNEHADDVATLVTDVANLKAIDHDAYKGADETVLASAKAYADGLATKYDAAGAAATALADAKAYADGLATNYDAAGSAATALTDAKAYTDDKIKSKANAADVYTKTEVYTKAEIEAMVITDAEIDALFPTANA